MLLQAQNLEKQYGDKQIFRIPEYTIFEGERIGLIGVNGAGKSTLLQVLSGELVPDAGTVRHHTGVAVVSQLGSPPREADPAEKSALGVARLSDEGRSGGEETRLKIAAAFSVPAGLLLADEPTTNLDAQGVALLRERLLAWPGGLLLISHDRALLDAVCTRIDELDGGVLTSYPGGYSDYAREKARLALEHRRAYDQYVEERDRLTRSAREVGARADRMKKTPARMGNAEARLHKRETTQRAAKVRQQSAALTARLSQLEEVERPDKLPSLRMAFADFPEPTSKRLLLLSDITLGYPGRPLLEQATLELPRGSRTALTGPNGSGKTTLLRHLCDTRPFAPSVVPAAFTQDLSMLRDNETMLQNARRLTDKPEAALRAVLAHLLLRGDDVHKRVALLSGGERCRLCIACLLLSGANLLLLDEPTNHLDIPAMEALSQVLRVWPGTLLFVSHDRAFTESVSDRFIKIENRHLLLCRNVSGDMDDTPDARAAQSRRDTLTALELRRTALLTQLSQSSKEKDRITLEIEYAALSAQIAAL
jgi:macrolide transport system ATP-binding/permease protein